MMTVVTMNVTYTLTMGICPKHRHHRHHRHRRRFLVTSMGFVLPPGNPSPVRGQPRRPAGLVSLVNRPKGGSWTSDRTPQRGELVRTRSVGINVRVTPTEKKRILKAASRCGLTLSEYLRQRALGYTPRFHPPQTFFSYLTWMENLNEQLEQYDPVLAEQYRRCREGLLDSLLGKEDASGDH